MRAGYAQRGSRRVEGVTGVKPCVAGRCPEHRSDRLVLVLGGERGESLVGWGLVENVIRRAGPVKGRRRDVTGEEGA